jgi:glycosyltransferase involved in cell wall biosynthesis
VFRVAAANALEGFGIPYPLFSHRLWSGLKQLVQTNEVVLAHSHTFLSSVVGAVAARRYRRPLVVLQHNPFVEYRFPWNVVEQGADLVFGRFTLRSASRLLAVSKHTARYVETLVPNRRVEVLPNGVATQRFAPVKSAQEREEIRSRLGLSNSPFILLTVRRLVFRNGLDTLLEACVRLKGRKDLLVVIAGSGPERPALEEFVRREGLDNVRLLGFVPDDLLPDLYRAADAFVLPTRTGEGFGLVLLEAFASGIPVIATRGGAQAEVVHEGRTGFLVAAESATELARAITVVQDHPQLRAQMGQAAWQQALTMDWEQNVTQLERALLQAVERRARADDRVPPPARMWRRNPTVPTPVPWRMHK